MPIRPTPPGISEPLAQTGSPDPAPAAAKPTASPAAAETSVAHEVHAPDTQVPPSPAMAKALAPPAQQQTMHREARLQAKVIAALEADEQPKDAVELVDDTTRRVEAALEKALT